MNTDTNLHLTQVTEIPTIATFLTYPDGTSLSVLEDWDMIPIGYEVCCYCHRLRAAHYFSRFQRWVTSARQKSATYDYRSWKPEKHFCIKCGIEHGHYGPGQRIYVGFGDAGSTRNSLWVCAFCQAVVDWRKICCEICGGCARCIATTQSVREARVPIAFFYEETCEHRAIMETYRALYAHSAADSYGNGPIQKDEVEPLEEPIFTVYAKKRPKEILALVGEKMLEDENDLDEKYHGIRPGYLNAVE